MGRVKLQIKKIQNNTNRQVTYSKRRNGLLKKAYELSVLCEVDVGVVMFSPSGRVSLFAGNNKSIEEIMARYVNLPEHERGLIQSQEHLNRLIAKLKEAEQNRQESSTSADSQREDLQEELKTSKSRVAEMEKRLRIFEGDTSEITTLTLDEVHYHEHMLEETLKQIRMKKEMLEGNYECHDISQPSAQVQMSGAEQMHLHGLAPREANNVFQWFPQRDPQVQVLNFLDSNGLLPQQREQTHHRHGADRMMMPSLNLLSGGNMNLEEHMSRSHRSSLTRDQDGVKIESSNISATNNRARVQDPSSSGYGHGFDVNLNSPWANHQFYQAGRTDHALPSKQPREGALLELFLSQFHREP